MKKHSHISAVRPRSARWRALLGALVTGALALSVAAAGSVPASAADPIVTFNYGDGTTPNATVTAINGQADLPAAPTWTDHVFAGWYTTPAGGRGTAPVTTGGGFFGPVQLAGITQDTTLYAKWIEDSAANPNTHQIATRDGVLSTVLGWSNYSGVKLISRAGAVVNPSAYTADGSNPIFKDLNGNGQVDVYEDWTKTTEQRAADLAAKLKADPDGVQQIAGLMLYSGHQTSWSSPAPTQDQVTFLTNDDLRHVLVAGSAPGDHLEIHAEWNNNVQSIVEGLGYGIPANNSSDPRHSTSSTSSVEYYTPNVGLSQWPSSLGMAATFNTAINKEFGKVASAEYRALGIATALSPQIDIATDPRWGRYNGTFGEDPKLASAMSRSYVDGFQTTYNNADGTTADVYDPISNDAAKGGWGLQSVNAMMKHWPGGGAGEGGRDAHYNFGKYAVYPAGNWAAHLIPFVDGSLSLEDGTDMATAVMPYYTISYLQTPGSAPNSSNTAAAKLNMANAYNDYMINGVLRDSYEFDGVVCTDWNVVGPQVNGPGFMFDQDLAGMIWGVDDHYGDASGIDMDGTFSLMAQRARMLLNAGVDQFGGLNTTAPIVKAYQDASAADKVTLLDQMEDSAYRLLKNIFRVGLFENPYLDGDKTRATAGQESFKAAGYQAQLESMVLVKNTNDLLPLAPGKKVYVPALPSGSTVASLETRFGAGNVITDSTAASGADVALVFVSSVSSGGGSRNATEHTNSYTPINLDFKSYTATNARETSVAGEPLRDAAGQVTGMENRSYKGKTTAAAAAATTALNNLAAARASGKPVIVVFNTSNPAVLTEIEPSAAALLVTFQPQTAATLDMLIGKTSYSGTPKAIYPTGMLPLQFPKDMNEVEIQSEDVPRDMVPYTDSVGNAYDFGFGLSWGSGTTTKRIDQSINAGYTDFVVNNTVAMTLPLNTGANQASAYSILNRAQVTFDYGYKDSYADKTNKQAILVVNKGQTVTELPATRAGHSLTGWYTPAGVKFDFSKPITGSTTLTAYWDGALPAMDTIMLAALVNTVKGLDKADYTAASYAALTAALQQAAALLAAGANPTSAQVKAAADAINAAVAGLVKVPAPKPGQPTPNPKPNTDQLTGLMISGVVITGKVGKALSVGKVAAPAGAKLAYKWSRGGKAIPGATGPSYTPTVADAGKTLLVQVSLVKADGSSQVIFQASAKIAKLTAKIKATTKSLAAKATLTVKVTAKGLKAVKGKVKLTWTKGKQKVAKTYKLKKGSAKVKLPGKVKNGTWTTKVAYKGSTQVAAKSVKPFKKAKKATSRNASLI